MEFVHRVPTEHMMSLRELREKRLLRESVKDLLPAFMGEVHKHPFLAPSWSDFRATREGRAMFADLLSSRAIQETGLLSNPTFQALRLLWPLTPRDSLLRKQLDLLMGLGLSLQMLHRNFIARPPLSDPHYRLQDRGHSVSV
jgi:asparagine synthase (glutamine-hydrolysing)